MLDMFIRATILGLSAGLAPGPMLTLVITQTLRYHVREGLKVAIVPLLSDLPIIALTWAVAARFAHLDGFLGALALAGSLYVLWMAWECWQTAPLSLVQGNEIAPRSLQRGIVLNWLNPHPYAFWLTVGVPQLVAARQAGQTAWALALVFVGTFYFWLVGSKLIVALVVGRVRNLLAGAGYIRTMRVLGVSLAVFALLLMREAAHRFGLLN